MIVMFSRKVCYISAKVNGGDFNMVEWDGDRIIEKLVLPGVEGAGFPLLNNRIKPKDDAN